MTINKKTAFLALVAASALLAAAGCKKKSQKSTESKQTSAMEATMQAMAAGDMRPTPRADMRPATMAAAMDATPAPRGAAWKPGALPVPADAVLVRLNFKAARATALYKTFEAKIKEWVAKESKKDGEFKAMVEKCGVNPLTAVDEVIFGIALDPGKKDNMVILVKGSFDTGKVMACMAPIVKKNKVKDVTIAGKKGGVYKDKKGKESTVLAFDAHTILFTAGAMQAKMADLIGGKAPTITTSAIFKQYGSKTTADTLLAVLVPAIPKALTAKMPLPVLQKVKAVAMMLSLPAGGLDLRVAIDVGAADQATQLAGALPMFLGMAKAKLGPLGALLTKNFKAKADGSWVKASLVLAKADFDKVVGQAKGLLGKL